jgi:type IV secretory pathway VirB6-like protein
MSQTQTLAVNNYTAPISYNRYLPTCMREIKVSRASDESFELGSDVLQMVAHVVRVNPVDKKLKVNAKNIMFRDKEYRVIWSANPMVEIYEMATGNGYIFDIKRGVVV